MKQLSLFFLCFSLLTCCASRRNITKDSTQTTVSENQSEELIATIGSDSTTSVRTTIHSAILTGNTLILEVSYSGGCGDHTFRLIGAEMISKSLPPIRGIQLIHHSSGDNCKALITKKLSFNIENLAYKKEHGSVIHLQLEGWKDKLIYTYN